MIEVKKKEGESANALLFRFTKKVKRSGILREAKKRRFRRRSVSRQKKRVSAHHREKKKKEIARLRKLGLL
ncbi:MAG: 30S ribosomal protein S21 [Candidatus Liptonbacteria bacterium]|nr:30S ribosomal protein S21 [Candidatus Liptonbacteria bacterium]